MTTVFQPFDLQMLLVNTLAGNLIIFTFLAIFVIAGMSAKFRMPALITGMGMLLFAILMGQWIPDFLIITSVAAAFIIGNIIGRIVKT